MRDECDYEDYVFDTDDEVIGGPLWCRLADGHGGPHRTTPMNCAGVNLSHLAWTEEDA